MMMISSSVVVPMTIVPTPTGQLRLSRARLSGQARQFRAVERGHGGFGARHAQPEAVGQVTNLRMLQHAEHGVTILLIRQRLVGDGLSHGRGIDNVALLRHG